MNQTPSAELAAVVGPISTATDTTIIAAPGTGKRLRIHGLRLSAAAAQKLTVKAGATALEAFNLAAGSQVDLPLRVQPYYTLPENTAFVGTSTTTGGTDGRVEYTVA